MTTEDELGGGVGRPNRIGERQFPRKEDNMSKGQGAHNNSIKLPPRYVINRINKLSSTLGTSG